MGKEKVMNTLIVIFIVLWLITGWAGFVYWWTKEYDYTYSDIPISILVAFMGIISWFAGRSIHGDVKEKEHKPIFKRVERSD